MQLYSKSYDGQDVYYDILDDGYKIYIGQTSRPSIHQYEPFIPDHTKTYEENAILTCEQLCQSCEHKVDIDSRLLTVEANIDYLMLLTDADSATEETE